MADDGLLIVTWNVEHGSAIYAKTPNGRCIVLDAGRSKDFSPAIWMRKEHSVERIDLFVLSHADADHIDDIADIAALEPRVYVRNRTVPRELVYDVFPPEKDPHKTFLEFDSKYTVDIPPEDPYSLRPESKWGGVHVRTFFNKAPDKDFPDLNDYSVVTFLIYGNAALIFPGDLEEPGWAALMESEEFQRYCRPNSKNKAETRILVASHHGREAGVYKPFLELCKPHLTIMSDVYGNETTDYEAYIKASLGYDVRDSKTGKTERRYVVTTKTNNYVKISADQSRVVVSV